MQTVYANKHRLIHTFHNIEDERNTSASGWGCDFLDNGCREDFNNCTVLAYSLSATETTLSRYQSTGEERGKAVARWKGNWA